MSVIPHDFDPFWMFKEGASIPFNLSTTSLQGVGAQMKDAGVSVTSNLAAGLVVDALWFGLRSWVSKTVDGFRVTHMLTHVEQHMKPGADKLILVSQATFDLMLVSYVHCYHEVVLNNHGSSRFKDVKTLVELWRNDTLTLERFIRKTVEKNQQFDDTFIPAGVNHCTLAFITNCYKPCGWITARDCQDLWNYYKGSSIADFEAKTPDGAHPLGAIPMGKLLRPAPETVMRYLDNRYSGYRSLTAKECEHLFQEVVRRD